jgi:5-methylcytosine-specific restriction endonuclease McrA
VSGARRRLVLDIVATDATFEPIELRGAPAWAGKCIHCNRQLVVRVDGTPVGPVTVEHLVPTSGGGTDALENLALACAGCNHEKGRRHDPRYGRTERSVEVVTRLLERRRKRFRPAPRSATPPSGPNDDERGITGT